MRLSDLFFNDNAVDPEAEAEGAASIEQKLDKILELLGGGETTETETEEVTEEEETEEEETVEETDEKKGE